MFCGVVYFLFQILPNLDKQAQVAILGLMGERQAGMLLDAAVNSIGADMGSQLLDVLDIRIAGPIMGHLAPKVKHSPTHESLSPLGSITSGSQSLGGAASPQGFEVN